MSNEYKFDAETPELEVRLTAMVMGEASDFERAQLEERPELAAWYEQLMELHAALSEMDVSFPGTNSPGAKLSVVGSPEAVSGKTVDDWSLTAERRQSLLAVIDGTAANPLSRTQQKTVEPAVPQPRRAKRRWIKRLAWGLAAAASLLACLSLLSLQRASRREGMAALEAAPPTGRPGASRFRVLSTEGRAKKSDELDLAMEAAEVALARKSKLDELSASVPFNSRSAEQAMPEIAIRGGSALTYQLATNGPESLSQSAEPQSSMEALVEGMELPLADAWAMQEESLQRSTVELQPYYLDDDVQYFPPAPSNAKPSASSTAPSSALSSSLGESLQDSTVEGWQYREQSLNESSAPAVAAPALNNLVDPQPVFGGFSVEQDAFDNRGLADASQLGDRYGTLESLSSGPGVETVDEPSSLSYGEEIVAEVWGDVSIPAVGAIQLGATKRWAEPGQQVDQAGKAHFFESKQNGVVSDREVASADEVAGGLEAAGRVAGKKLEAVAKSDAKDKNNRREDSLLQRKETLAKGLSVAQGLDELTAARDPFSTFSLHVSDVSFKLALSSLANGQWPDASKIRLEEFVNAMDYYDPLPTSEERVACQIEQAVHPSMLQRNMMRVSLRTAATGRPLSVPLRLTLLLDNSGSMERPDRRQAVRRAFEALAKQLGPNDQVTLISFANTPRLLAEKVSGAKVAELVQLVESMPSQGGTNIEAALQLAMNKATESARAAGTNNAALQNRIVLMTDGAVNLGDADPASLSRLVIQMRNAGIAFDAAGISAQDLNDEVLEALTRQGDGRYYLLDSAEEASSGFAEQIAGALRPAAKNVKVQVEFNPDRVGHYKLLGFEKHLLKAEDFRNDQVDAAEMAAAEAGVAMYQFEPRPDGHGDIGSVSVRFQDLATGLMVERRWPIPYDATPPRLRQADPKLRVATAAVLLAAKLRGDALGANTSYESLGELLSSLPEVFQSAQRVQQLRKMLDLARQLSQ